MQPERMEEAPMEATINDPRVLVTPSGTYCLYDSNGRFVGTIESPVARQPLGPGREKVLLVRPTDAQTSVAA